MYGSSAGNVAAPSNIYGSRADETWWLTINLPSALPLDANPVYVGVIDEGICFNHPDLDANVGNLKESGPGDNDGNGKDDPYGWDFISEDNTVFDPVTGQPDIDAHGTHVAGTIGAEIGNDIGVVGVFPGVRIISGKFLAPNGGTTFDAIEAVDYFTDLKARGVNIVALNNSWGGGGYSAELHAAIIRAANAGILFIAAAGNGNWAGIGQNNDNTPSYPASYDTTKPVTISGRTYVASYDSVIAVAAITSSGSKAGFSNYGAKSVDIGAPGVGIVSTYPYNLQGSDPKSTASRDPVRGAYIPYNGTSMATPHVTGAAALYAARWPDASAAAIKGAILKTAIPTTSLSGKTVTGGRLNLELINQEPEEVPNAPGDLQLQPGSKGQIKLTWIDSGPETQYTIQRATNSGFTSGLTTITVGANVTSYVDKSLKSRTTYHYRVRAANFAGTSPYSNIQSLAAP
jgi:subtilisin family serine protease